MADFFSGFASGFASGRQRKSEKQNAALKAAHEAFQQQVEQKKLEIEQTKFDFEKSKFERQMKQDQEKFEYQKTKDKDQFGLEISKYQSEKEFKKAQTDKINAEIGKMARDSTKEQLEMQASYFATWGSLSPQQQTDLSKKALINSANSSGMIDEAQAARLHKMTLPEFNMFARAGLGMSTKALDAQKYFQPNKTGDAPSGYRYKDDGKTLEPIPGGPASAENKPVPAEKAKYETQVNTGLSAIQELKDGFEKGDFTGSTVMGASTPGFLNPIKSSSVQRLEALKMKAAEMFGRIQSGGAINKDEEKRFLGMLPTVGDTQETINMKLKSAEDYYNEAAKNIHSTPSAKKEAPSMQFKLPSGKIVDSATLGAKAKQYGMSVEEVIQKLKAAGAEEVGGASSPAGESKAPIMEK